MDWRWLLKALAHWLRRNLIQAILSAVIGALVGTAIQILVVAVLVEGNQDLLARFPNHPLGRPLQASLFWGLLNSLVFGLFGYWRAVGTKRFLNSLVTLPFRLQEILTRDGPGASSHLLWGAAIGLVASLTVNPYVGWLLAAGVVALTGSLLGRVVASLLSAAYYSVMRWISPNRARPLSTETAAIVGMLGSALSMVVAGFVPGMRLPLAVACGVGAVALSRRGPPAPVASVLLLLLLGTDHGWADDGGWQEGGGNLSSYLNTPGSDQVWRPGAVGGGVGAPVGLGLGHAAGSGDPGGGDRGGGDRSGRDGGGGGGKPDSDKPGPRVPYTQDHCDRLNDIGNEITDPDLYQRYLRLLEQAEGGSIDEKELADLESRQDRLAQQRHEQIVREQEDFSRQWNEQRLQREAAEAAQEQARRDRERQVEAVERMIDHSDDPEQQQRLQEFLNRHRDDNPEDFDRASRAIRSQTVEAEQQRNMGEAEQAQEEADAYRQSQEFAEETRDWANRTNRILANLVPGGQRVVDLQNLAQAGAEGYGEDGWRGAAQRAGANLLDNYTQGGGTAALDAYREGSGVGGFVENFVHNNVSQYDPREYANRIREGGLGGLVDAALDAHDAHQSLRGGGDGHEGDGVGVHRGGDEDGGHPARGNDEAGPSRGGDEASTRRGDDDAGPTRRGEDEAGPTRRRDDEAGPTRRGDDDTGPTRQGEDEAGPTRPGDEEAGPTRRGHDDEAGPTRRGDDEAGPTRRGDDEGGPTRRGHDDEAGQTRRGDEEAGPTRRGHDDEAGPTRRGDDEAGPTRRGDDEGGPTRRGHDDEAGQTRRGDDEAGPTRRGDDEGGPTRRGEPEDMRPPLSDRFGNTPERADVVRRMQDLETARQQEGQVQHARENAERDLQQNRDRVQAIQRDLQSGAPRTREDTRQMNEDLRRAREDVQHSSDHLDRARQAEDRARNDLDRARQNLEDARRARLDTDPYGAARLAQDRAQEASHAETRASSDFRDAVREAVRNPNDAEAQARVRETHDRMQEARRDARDAQQEADHWRQRRGEQAQADRDRLDAFNRDFQNTYGHPGAQQDGYNVPRSLETQDDPHSVFRERNPATDSVQVPVTGTGARFEDGTQVEVAGTRRDGTSDRTDSISVPRSQSGAVGFHDPQSGRVVSSTSQVDLAHEAGGHGHTHDNFRDAYGNNRNINEGFTEFIAQDYRDRVGLQEPAGFDPSRPYPPQTQATYQLANYLDPSGTGAGRDAIIRAQLHGDVDQLHQQIGQQRGITDPVLAQQEGQRVMQLFADGDYSGFRTELGIP